jgi:hypothetical protein
MQASDFYDSGYFGGLAIATATQWDYSHSCESLNSSNHLLP